MISQSLNREFLTKISTQNNFFSLTFFISCLHTTIYVQLLCIVACVCLWNLVCEVWSRVMRQISNSKGRFLTIYGNSDEEGSTTDKICRMKRSVSSQL